MSAPVTAPVQNKARPGLSKTAKRGVWIGVIVVVVALMVLGTRFVPSDSPLLQAAQKFDPATFGAENFPVVQEEVVDRAVDASVLAEAIAADPAAAAAEYGVESSGGTVFSTTFTGVVGEGQSGIYEIQVEGLPDDLLIRVQTGPAVTGTELRDATGEIKFGEFKNQIEYQNAAAALNEELKTQVLAGIDAAALAGTTVTVTGAFTLVNPSGWLVTPVELDSE
ncbi:DUF2291 family protein [Microbacterium aerolatum]|uniref:Lipoprotein n=1 Tax=Microbacterium aerolatum TaxID=153731 RepID=A0A511AAP6_9MICO|nr:DUF2291 family protein [Microbacterium aerolatum]GEK85264.1 lipoprotein [Microbacterium aerolatum]GGB29766.1 lipoprotein [Microbacterium aerolatum]